MRAYSMDLRVRVLADCDAGLRTGAVARKFSVSPAWVRRLKQRRAAGLGVGPTEGRPGPRPALADGPDADRLAALRRRARPQRRRVPRPPRPGPAPHHRLRTLRRLGLTFKKK